MKTLSLIRRFSLALSSGCLAFIVLLTVADVFGRYLLDYPISASLELTELAMVGTIFFALPVLTLRGGHVVVDLLEGLFNARLLFLLDSLADLIFAVAFVAIGWRLFLRAGDLARFGDTTAVLAWPIYPFAYLMAALAALTGVAAASRFLARLIGRNFGFNR